MGKPTVLEPQINSDVLVEICQGPANQQTCWPVCGLILRPYTIVDAPTLKKLIQVLAIRYSLPSMTYFRNSVIPALYQQGREGVAKGLEKLPALL